MFFCFRLVIFFFFCVEKKLTSEFRQKSDCYCSKIKLNQVFFHVCLKVVDPDINWIGRRNKDPRIKDPIYIRIHNIETNVKKTWFCYILLQY